MSLKITSVFVTHDQEEAWKWRTVRGFDERRPGRASRARRKKSIIIRPMRSFDNFFGNVNLFHSRVEEGKVYPGELPIELPAESAPQTPSPLWIFVRPHSIGDRAPTEWR